MDSYWCESCKSAHMRGWSCSYDPGPGKTKLHPGEGEPSGRSLHISTMINGDEVWQLDQWWVRRVPGHLWDEIGSPAGKCAPRYLFGPTKESV